MEDSYVMAGIHGVVVIEGISFRLGPPIFLWGVDYEPVLRFEP